jgi:hypothetical protein
MKGKNKMERKRLITLVAKSLELLPNIELEMLLNDLFVNCDILDIDRLVLELGIKKSEEQELGLNELREIFKEEQ